jgi:serine/threonine protein kinase
METKDPSVKYIAEGSFGCVFSSKIQCRGDNEITSKGSKKYVSKVSVVSKDEMIDKEILLGKMIVENVRNYDYYFAPILNSCPINIGVIDNEEIKRCEIVSSDKDASKREYVSSTLKYVGKNSLCEYLDTQKKNEKKQIKTILETHLHLMNALQKLLDLEDSIVHYDLKDGNIIFDEEYNVPIIIDYGLSFTKSQLFMSPLSIDNLKKMFYVYYEKYSAWNIETVLLSYITQSIILKENVNVAYQVLQPYYENLINVVDDFVAGSILFDTNEERSKFENDTKKYLSKFEKKPIRILIDELSQRWKSWDNYSIAVMYYIYILENKYLLENKYINLYRMLLKEIIYSTLERSRHEPSRTYESIMLLSRL